MRLGASNGCTKVREGFPQKGKDGMVRSIQVLLLFLFACSLLQFSTGKEIADRNRVLAGSSLTS